MSGGPLITAPTKQSWSNLQFEEKLCHILKEEGHSL
jgi:hypothetical protein